MTTINKLPSQLKIETLLSPQTFFPLPEGPRRRSAGELEPHYKMAPYNSAVRVSTVKANF